MTSSNVGGTSRSYAYNGDGIAQAVSESGGTAYLLWDPSRAPTPLLQVDADRVVYGLGPLYYALADGSLLALARDGSKSVRAEVNGSGSVAAAFRYRAYGDLAQTTGPLPGLLGYAGLVLDSSGLYYLRARWYDPAAGRFITRDPVTGEWTHPARLNAFGYAHANPVVKRDETGLAVPEELHDDSREGAGGVDDCVEAFPCGPVGPVSLPLGTAIASALNQLAAAVGERAVTVYRAVDRLGRVIYVGITYTDRFNIRIAEHGLRFGQVEFRQVAQVPNRLQARATEQVLIELLPNLANKINSISPRNPVYEAAIDRGLEVLVRNAYRLP